MNAHDGSVMPAGELRTRDEEVCSVTEDERLDLYADVIHDIAVILGKGGTPLQKNRAIQATLASLYGQLAPNIPLKEAV